MAPHWIGTNGQHLGVEILPLLQGFGGSSHWSNLFSGPSWGTGLTSDSGRTIGLGGGTWPTPSLASTPLPRFRTPLSGLHGLGLTDFLGLPADTRLLEATRDAWIWRQPRFSAKATYRLLCGQMSPEDTHIIQRCWLIWKRHIPLKIRIICWLLLRRRLMTRAVRQHMYPDSPLNCPLCGGDLEDCSHLFF